MMISVHKLFPLYRHWSRLRLQMSPEWVHLWFGFTSMIALSMYDNYKNYFIYVLIALYLSRNFFYLCQQILNLNLMLLVAQNVMFLSLQGCDGSVLLDDTPTMTGEKTAKPNNNSIRGFDVIDSIKSNLNDVCQGNVVSCADILAVAARDSIVALGGSSYSVLLGRRDATSASQDAANSNIPAPNFNLSQLLSNFDSQGLSMQDLVVLSGAHTLGFARCTIFRNRIYNESTIDPDYAASLESVCPISGDDDVLASLDDTPASVDTDYYQGLIQSRGLLDSDQQLYQGDGSDTDSLVQYYSDNPANFWSDFGTSMINLGNLNPLTGDDGEVRENCRIVNQS
ncbi:hypothetical protein LUZ61_003288 [Rhynchospora tenuis]|uniref:Peroxidase n=1 Tax=Rhynchospora tenuis TaxID=198213 RepID=A0AAD6ESH4_9POAL|nr:hypothetical protein LUZ61_003288 [Rhynchospora tenuis]